MNVQCQWHKNLFSWFRIIRENTNDTEKTTNNHWHYQNLKLNCKYATNTIYRSPPSSIVHVITSSSTSVKSLPPENNSSAEFTGQRGRFIAVLVVLITPRMPAAVPTKVAPTSAPGSTQSVTSLWDLLFGELVYYCPTFSGIWVVTGRHAVLL